jgi:hypothetical protein
MSFETSFNSKQPKLEPKLVLPLSETKRLFRLFRFSTETGSFGISIEPKQTEEQPKQCDREHILVFFSQNLGLFRFKIPKQTEIFCFWFNETTETKPKQIMFRFVSVRTENIFVLFRGHPTPSCENPLKVTAPSRMAVGYLETNCKRRTNICQWPFIYYIQLLAVALDQIWNLFATAQ